MLVKLKKRDALFAIGLAASAGPSVLYVNVLFTPGLRWLILLILFGSILYSRKLFYGLRGGAKHFGISILFFVVLSTLWSEVPNLSATKSITYFFVALVYSAAGALCAQYSDRKYILNVLWPVTLLALFAGLGGLVNPGSIVQMNQDVSLFRGLTFNSNFLGMLVLASLPLPLWRLSQNSISVKKRRYYIALLVLLVFILLTTFSRASFLAAFILVLFYTVGQRRVGRYVLVGLTISFLILLGLLFAPDQVDDFIFRYVYKGADRGYSVLASRSGAWEATYEGALAGGVFGLGYGVSHGFTEFSLGFSSSSYGREKGAVFLAIIEEVGMVGLSLYLLMLFSILNQALSAYRLSRNASDRNLIALLSGYVIALNVHAQFEAWLFSPGGAITPVYWATIGMLSMVCYQIRRSRR